MTEVKIKFNFNNTFFVEEDGYLKEVKYLDEDEKDELRKEIIGAFEDAINAFYDGLCKEFYIKNVSRFTFGSTASLDVINTDNETEDTLFSVSAKVGKR